MASESIPRIPIQVSRDCVVASIQIDLSEGVLRRFRVDFLEMIRESEASNVILDVSGVEVMDGEDFQAIRNTMHMANLLGARSVLAGLRPGVVSSLIELGVDAEGFETALNLDEAFRLMEQSGEGQSRGVPNEEDGDGANYPHPHFD
jgi:rsbT antagonist protein RsbS